jgi:hypothetical protein
LKSVLRKKIRYFSCNVNIFAVLSKTICFFTLNRKFVSFRSGLVFFLDTFDRNGFNFPFDHSDLRIKPNVLFRYRNELKIRPQRQIGFMHVDITTRETIPLTIVYALSLKGYLHENSKNGNRACIRPELGNADIRFTEFESLVI